MSEERSYDVVVVGGGVIGLATAWRLAQAGATVTVLERAERPPGGATRVAAGMLAPVGELTFGEPDLLELTLVAAELYPGFVAELEEASGIGTGYEARGALHVALDRDEAEQLRRAVFSKPGLVMVTKSPGSALNDDSPCAFVWVTM